MKAIKAQVKQVFFPEAADLWEDYLIMREQGYCVADVAKKHNVPEERTREIIKDINIMVKTQLEYRLKSSFSKGYRFWKNEATKTENG